MLLDCDLPRPIVQEHFPKLDEYLRSGTERSLHRRYIPSRRTPWYRQEKRLPVPFLSTYMGRGSGEKKPFRFVWNRSQAVATNVYLLLYPKPLLAELLEDEDKADQIHQALNQIEADELRAEGRVYGGGLYKMEPGELSRMSAVPLLDALPELERHIEI